MITSKRIVVYGSRGSPVFEEAEQSGVKIVQLDTDTSKVFSRMCS